MVKGKELEKAAGANVLQKVGARYGVDEEALYQTLCQTVFKTAQNKEQVIALMIVADQYHLNPFTREIYAFPDKKSGGIVPVVGIDGWLRMINEHPQFVGMEIRESDESETMTYTVQGEHGDETRETSPAPEWMECVIYRKDREHHPAVREYLREVYRATEPWQKNTSRMLRHKTIIQAARVTLGFGGIKDPDEAEAIQAFDLEGTVLQEETLPTIGPRNWTKLVKQAGEFGYTEADVMATAETQGFSGAGCDLPERMAQAIYAGMKASPKIAADPETGEVTEEPQAGHRTPLLD
jgi:phage recombination protein Bet